MRDILTITKALNDATRLRSLMALRQDELCLCQLVELLELAPSTVSRHMNLLFAAGLVDRRKEGRWVFYRLAGRTAPAPARSALRWVTRSLARDPEIERDAGATGRIRGRDLEELCACYT